MATETPQLPPGHTFTKHANGSKYGAWVYLTHATKGSRVTVYHISTLRPFMHTSNGVVHWRSDIVDEWQNSVRPIPDSQHPAGGMTEQHTVFNEATGKWEYPSIESAIHSHHETQLDSDVGLAHDNLCIVQMFEEFRQAVVATLTSENLTKFRSKLNDFYDCQDDLIDESAVALLTTAHIKSVGFITLPATAEEQHEKALAFARAAVNLIQSKSASELVRRRYEYILRLRDELIKDRDRETTQRFLPRQVILVETEPQAADPTRSQQVTTSALFDKLKAAVNPAT